MEPEVSIIIVHYSKPKLTLECIESIYKCTRGIFFETIIVDNSSKGFPKKKLVRYKNIKYIRSSRNLGYAVGNNLGARYARGMLLFILNPDTKFVDNILPLLSRYLLQSPKVAIVAPMLLDKEGNNYFQIGVKQLTPLRSAVVLSFINKIFPDNLISSNYWAKKKKLMHPFPADIVGGSAFLIKKKVFDKVKGFDEKFFLFFEEVDLCKQILNLGYQIKIFPQAKILHYWKASTPKTKHIKKVFESSRFYYFRKNYGIISAFFVEIFARMSKKGVTIILVLFLTLIALTFLNNPL